MLSIVIPTLNSAATLTHCIERVANADEIIIVDGGSSDETRALAGRSGARVVMSDPGRGTQLRLGAEAARGDWLLFLHADTMLATGWREAVDLHIATRSGRAAFFRFRLDTADWRASFIEAGVSLRTRLLKLPYGDQGLLISRRLYREIGGYRPLPLMEDVELIRRIGRHRLRSLPVAATTSAERWQRDGWLRRSARNLCYILLYRAGVSPERLSELYD